MERLDHAAPNRVLHLKHAVPLEVLVLRQNDPLRRGIEQLNRDAPLRADGLDVSLQDMAHVEIAAGTGGVAAGRVLEDRRGWQDGDILRMLAHLLYCQGREKTARPVYTTVGWSIVGVIAGRYMVRVGYQRLALAGTVTMLLGSAMLLVQTPIAPVLWVGVCTLVIGAGLGTLNTPLLIMIQSVVGWEDRGVVTALNQFSRTIGGAWLPVADAGTKQE